VHYKTYLIFLAFIQLVSSRGSLAQLPRYQLSRLLEQDGLKTADLLNITTDKDGYMWLASQGEVQRFDGRHTLHFPFAETVGEVYADNQNRKWVITRRKIFLFVNPYIGFKEIKCFPDTVGYIIKIFERRDGPYLLRSGGQFRYNERRQAFEWIRFDMEGSSKMVTNFIGLPNAEYWSDSDSIFRYNPSTKKKLGIPFKSKYHTLAIGPDALLISTTAFKTWHVNVTTGITQLLSLPAGDAKLKATDFLIFCEAPLDSGKYLLGTNKGLVEYDSKQNTASLPVFYFNGQPFQSQQPVKGLYKDENGTIYICNADGIFQLFTKSNAIQYVRNYTYKNEHMPSNDVRNFAEDQKGDIWMATTNGIVKMNMQSGALTVNLLAGNNPIQYPSYRQLLNNGPLIWIGSSGNGVWVFNKTSGRFYRPQPYEDHDSLLATKQLFDSTYIWKILKLRNGQILAVGGGRSFIIDPEKLLYRRVKFSSSGQSSRSAMQDSSGRIWHGTSTGLTCLDSLFKTNFSIKDSFPDRRVAALCEWRKDKILIGTKGLYELQVSGNHLSSFERKKGIPAARFIYCMCQDRQGLIWMGTDEGIFRYDPVKDISVLFDQSHYVQTQAFNSDGAFMSSKGLMFLGGLNGINYFFPEAVGADIKTLKPHISSFIINGSDSAWVSLARPYTLPYENRNLDFSISAPEFLRPFSIRYRYKLQAKESNWISNGFGERVRINHLDPGEYALQVSASYDGVSWHNAPGLLPFIVSNAWWRSWWFRLFYISFAAAAVWAYIIYRKRKREAAEMKQVVNYFALSGNQRSATADILWDIARNCISRLQFEDCVIYLLDESTQMLVQKAAFGAKNPDEFQIANPIEIPVGKGITGHVAATGASVLVNDTSKDGRYIVDDVSRLSELAVPILHEGKVIGVIDSEHHRRHFFKLQHQQTLEQIAAICSSKIAKAMAVEAMRIAEAQLSGLNSKIMEAKFMNLRLQMNPHFLFNTLNSIQYLVVSGQTAKATKYLNVFSGFLRSLLQFAEDTLVSLDDEIRILHLYVDLESLSLDETFVYQINVDEKIETEDVFVPFMLLQPFVENAIHHGLMPRIGEKHFTINIIDIDDEQMECTIEDNGVGREMAAEIKARKMRAARHESKGVNIVKQRLELLGQKTGKQGDVVYSDIIDGNGKPGGTRVSIIIPYYNSEDI
jgi:ligand-binding sensor domain-containing protein/putative methionine-R-sulfoxide reductase with GAF domain